MNRANHIIICLTLFVLTQLGGILLPSDASCRMTGAVDFSYVDYDSSDNTQHISAHALTQHYSVLYDTSGKLANGRLGKYDVALGYEWLTFDTGIKSSASASENYNESKGHVYYRGEVLIDPKEIPFRLTLFSRDLNQSRFVLSNLSYSNDQNPSFTGSSISSLPGQTANLSHYISVPSDVATSISNGTHIESGATLVMGVKNGMTNGYNETLRHFPMLMLDYRDQIDKEKNSLNPVDSRLTRLAFISLNKKDNWFHYRYLTYNDYIDESNSYNEAQIQLGTVDHMLRRRWIDFANWLIVSVDGQLTKRMQARTNENYEEFRLNLFGAARRQTWELRTFNNFTRLSEYNIGRITYNTSLPVYVNGILSPTVNWNAYAKYNDNHTDNGSYFNTATGGYTIDAFNKSYFSLSQGLGVEQVSASGNSENLILTGSLSTASTPFFSRDWSVKANYNIRNYRYNTSGNSSNFTDQEIKATASYNLTNTLRIMAEQTNRFTTGTSQYLDSSIPGSTVSSAQYISPSGNINNSGGSGYQSITALSVAWTPKPRLNVGFLVTEDIYVPKSGERTVKTKLAATVEYTGGKLKISSRTEYNSDDLYNGEKTSLLSSTNTVNYTFSRSLAAKVGVSYFKTTGSTNQINSINAEQAIDYSYYQNGGMRRKIFEISETFTTIDENSTYSDTVSTAKTSKKRVNTFTLGTKYYPLRQMMIAGGARYSFVKGFDNDAINYYGSLSVYFRLLEASIDYSYGKNKVDNRMEKKLMANIKKKF